MAVQPTHWRERAIAKAEGISDGLEVAKAYGARIAEWVLLGCLFVNILEMFPLPVPDWFGNAVLAVQAITLDLAGFGLTSMGEHARRQGNHRAATTASRMGWTLISLMMLTVGLVTLSVLLPKTKEFVDGAEKALILVRVVVTVLYGHVVHSLRQASATYTNDLSALQEELDRRVQEVDGLRATVERMTQEHRALAKQSSDELRAMVAHSEEEKQAMVNELRATVAAHEADTQAMTISYQERVVSLSRELQATKEHLVQAMEGRRGQSVKATAKGDEATDPAHDGYVALDDGETVAIANGSGKTLIATGSHRDRIKQAMLLRIHLGKDMSYQDIAQAASVGYSTVKKYAPIIRQELEQCAG